MASERNFSVKPYINLREKLAQNFSAHPQVGLYLRHHTAVIDKFVKDCAAFAKVPPTCAIAALGGYGRREMFPYSDIDVAVLTPEGLSQADQTAIAEFVTLLWSLGLTVGTNVRTKAETLKITASDITAATAFLEARWIYGNKALFKDTHDTFLQELDSRMFFRSKMLEMRQRHQKYGDTPYALEPNIKEGLGGLRDLQVFLWYAKAAGYGTSWKEMAQAGLITGTEAYHFTQCTHFLRELRIRLHLICGRHEDRLIMICRDDGVGMSQQNLSSLTRLLEQEENTSKHSGLYNIHRRIQILYGRLYGVEIRSLEGHGTTLIVTIPAHGEENHAADFDCGG